MKALIWSGEELGATFDEVDIPDDLKELADEYREKIIDAVVELDDAVRALSLQFLVFFSVLLPASVACFCGLLLWGKGAW